MLSKKLTYDHLVTENGNIQVRRITRIMEDGEEIAKEYHRHVVNPGDSVDKEDSVTKKIAKVIHTKEVIDNYKKKAK